MPGARSKRDLKKSGPSQSKKNLQDGGGGPPSKKGGGKKTVVEIDGNLWLLDDLGNPLKKVRRKGEGGGSSAGGGGGPSGGAKKGSSGGRPPPPNRSKSSRSMKGGSPDKKKNKNVKEIDGHLFLLDEAGNPLKRIRKKTHEGSKDEEGEHPSPTNRRSSLTKQKSQVRRGSSSSSRPLACPKEYIDEKGRKVIIEADGSKFIIGKNGKRMRPKKKDGPPNKNKSAPSKILHDDDDDFLAASERSRANSVDVDDFFNDMPDVAKGEGNIFDELWDDIPGSCKGGKDKNRGGDDDSGEGEDNEHHHADNAPVVSLAAKIDEVGKQNHELAVKLQTAEEEIEVLCEENKKEKAKNVKAVTEVMQVKAEFTEANNELNQLREMVQQLKSEMSRKEQEMQNLNNIREKTAELERLETEKVSVMRASNHSDGGDSDSDVSIKSNNPMLQRATQRILNKVASPTKTTTSRRWQHSRGGGVGNRNNIVDDVDKSFDKLFSSSQRKNQHKRIQYKPKDTKQ